MKNILTFLTLVLFSFQANSQLNCPLACNDNLNVSFDNNGEILFTPDMIQEGSVDPVCEPFLQVSLSTINGGVILPFSPTLDLTCIHEGTFVAALGLVQNGAVYNTCWGMVTFEDKTNVCPDNVASGHVAVSFLEPLSGPYAAKAYLNGNEMNQIPGGVFELPLADVLAGNNEITFDSYPSGINGVTSLDVVIIQKLLLELQTETPEHIIAADIDRSGFVGTADIVKTRHLILGVETNTNTYALLHQDATFPNIDLFDFGADFYTYKFDGADVGSIDFTFSASQGGDMQGFKSDENSDNRSGDEILYFSDFDVLAGETYDVDFKLNAISDFKALQTSIMNKGYEVIEVNFNYAGTELMTNEIGRELRLSFLSNDVADSFEFSMKIKALKTGKISDILELSPDFDHQIASNDLEVSNIRLESSQVSNNEDLQIEAIQIYPNPINASSIMKIPSNLADSYNYEIYNLNGQLVSSGYSNDSAISLDADKFDQAGLYTIIVFNKDINLSQKFVIQK